MIFGTLALSAIEAVRLHLPTGDGNVDAGAWRPQPKTIFQPVESASIPAGGLASAR